MEKFYKKELSEAEGEEFMEWLKDPLNRTEFESYIEVNFLLNEETSSYDNSKAFRKVEAKIGSKSTRIIKLRPLLKYAAVFAIILGVSAFHFFTILLLPPSEDHNEVTVKLENGKIQLLDIEAEGRKLFDEEGVFVGTQKRNLIDHTNSRSVGNLVYSTLKIPYGKTFKVILSDGSKITLNAGSKLKYPTRFLEHGERKVYLEGEAFFDVAEDPNRKFIVKTTELDVSVYGTEFNISAYDNDITSTVVLVDGSVGVKYGDKFEKISPGQAATANHQTQEFSVETVKVEPHIAWAEGKTIFIGERFEEIIKVLERKHDIKIINNYDELNDQKFTAFFEGEDIEKILNLFKTSRDFRFKLSQKNIVISAPAGKSTSKTP